MRRVFGMGETTMDILFRHRQPVAAVPGGSCFNSIISVGRTGTPSWFMGYAGDDAVGSQTADFLTDNGVHDDFFVRRKGEKSSLSLAYLNEQGDADYLFYKSPLHMDGQTPIPELTSSDILLFGSHFASCDGTRQFVRHMQTAADQAGSFVYYDLNFRRSHLPELDHLMPAIQENFRKSTLVRGSADDFEVMYGERDARSVYDAHIARWCPLFICTAGAEGITACTPDAAFDFEVPHLQAVSTVGAGDNFNAGFIYALINYDLHASDLLCMNKEGWARLVKVGCDFAAQVCQSEYNNISKEFAANYRLV